MTNPALLALADGTIFQGASMGASGVAVGEVVFNTSMTGYQEILTDPSYAQQIINLTYPQIGNTGCNHEDVEAGCIFSKGLVIRDLPKQTSSFRASVSLDEFLKQRNVVGIAQIDNRQLTRVLRDKGAQPGCIMHSETTEPVNANKAIEMAQQFSGLAGQDLAQVVTTAKSYDWVSGLWSLANGYAPQNKTRYKVVAYDFGVKHNILRLLHDRGCELTVVPAKTSAEDVLAMHPDGIFLSNGPGDPEPCDYAVAAIQTFFKEKLPVFGICLGHQLMALASGARSFKMKTGHHGANHPVQEVVSKKVFITSQNHGFAVADNDLPESVVVTHRSLFDNTIQGLRWQNCPAFSFQGHPEASPGPQDIVGLFDEFIALMDKHHA